MALTIPTRHVDEGDPAADTNLMVTEINRLGGLVDGQRAWVVPASGASDDDLIDAALASGYDRILFPARAYVVNRTHTVVTNYQQIMFSPGATIKIGESPTGLMATCARVLALSGRVGVTIVGARFLAPTTELATPPGDEVALIHIEDSTDCVVSRTWADMDGLFDPGEVNGEGYGYSLDVVLVKGASSDRNVVSGLVARNCRAVTYSYAGACRTVVRDVWCYDSPQNGLSGIGNAGTFNDACVLEDVHVFDCARIGVEDWARTRGTRMRDVYVRSAGLMGISAVGVGAVIEGFYLLDPGSYAGVELSTVGSVVRDGKVHYSTQSDASGVVVDGGTGSAPGFGDPGVCTSISGVEVVKAGNGIASINNYTYEVLVEDCRIKDWKHRGITLVGTGTGTYRSRVSRCYLEQNLPTNNPTGGARYGIQVNDGSVVRDNVVKLFAAANGGTHGEFVIYLGPASTRYLNNEVVATGVTSPFVPAVTSFGATPAGVVIDGLSLAGVTFSAQYLASPVVRNVTSDTTTDYGSGAGGTSPVRVSNGGGVQEWAGTGSPETVVTAPVGSRYYRRDGGAGTAIYVKETGSAATGWVGK